MKRKMKLIFVVSIVVSSLLCLGSLTHAQGSEEKAWSWRLVPFYGWFTFLDGTAGIGNQTESVDVDFDQIFDQLEFVYMGHFEGVWRQTAGFFTDFIYTKLGAEKEVAGIKTKVDLTQPIAEGGLFYRLNSGPSAFDFLGGIRYYGLKLDVTVGDQIQTDTSKSTDWIDGIAGLRWQVRLAEQWALATRGDLGFGGSNLSWNVAAYIDWQPWTHFSLTADYRALGVDYEEGEGVKKFTYDMITQGPVLGFSIVW